MNSQRRHRSAGFAAATALFTIGVFVLLGAVLASASRSNAKARQFQETKEQMVAQRDLISNMLLLCRSVYPGGDNGSGNGVRVQYPATPVDSKVASITCPGQGAAVSIWSGDARAMAPRTLPGFTAWTYTNDLTSIRISTSSAVPASKYYQDLIDSVIARIGANQAVRSTDTLTITLIN